MLLVTGVTGHTGGYFLQQLIENKFQDKIRFIVRKSSNIDVIINSGLNYEIVYGDINNHQFLMDSMQGITDIVHIYNIHNSKSILKAAINNDVKKVVLVHTTGRYSQFKEASAGYIKIENDIKQMLDKNPNNMQVIILRPSMIYGDLCDHNMSKFIKMVDKLKVLPVIDGGKSLIQPVNARDLGKAYYTALTQLNESGAYDLTGDRPLTMKEALSTIATNLNKKIYFLNVPLGLGVFGARVLKVCSFNKFDVVEKVQRMAENRSYSHEMARKAFGYSPITFEQGIAVEVNQYLQKNRGNKK